MMFESHDAVHARYTQVIAGIGKRITTAVTLANTTYATAANLAEPFQAWIGAAAATASAKAAYHAAVLNEEALYKVFHDLAPRFKGRPGGYTRLLKKGFRTGDAAPISMVELLPAAKTEAPEGKGKAKGKSAKPAPARDQEEA